MNTGPLYEHTKETVDAIILKHPDSKNVVIRLHEKVEALVLFVKNECMENHLR